MNEESTREIIDFINAMYHDQVHGPVKFVVQRKVRKIKKLHLEDFPESLRSCTVGELIQILKDAYNKKPLNF